MPWKPKRPCGKSGCPELIETGQGYCEKHKTEKNRAYEESRGTSNERGYGARWQRYRKMFLAENPVCASCGGLANEVDHIEPPDGPDDPKFWDPSNHQALCKPCHSGKTAKEDGRWG